MNNSVDNVTSRVAAADHSCAFYDIQCNLAVRITMPLSFAAAFCVLIGVISIFLNSLLLHSLWKTSRAALRAKEFIVGLCVVNCSLPIATALNPVYLGTIFGFDKNKTAFCFVAGHTVFLSTLFIVQPQYVAGLACDRLYAVTKPFKYNAVGYGKRSRIFLLPLPWTVAAAVWMFFLLSVHESLVLTETSPHRICSLMAATHFSMESAAFIDAFYIALSAASVFLYIFMFRFLKYQRGAMEKISKTSVKTQQLYVTLAYFVSMITSLTCYLLAPVYSVFVGGALRQGASEETKTTYYVLSMINLINCCVDPLILIRRIPAIRGNLPIKKKAMTLSSRGVSSVELSFSLRLSSNFRTDA